jgi:hypothetical protein
MTDAHYHRDGVLPVDCAAPPLPRVPDLPDAYTAVWRLALAGNSTYEMDLWRQDRPDESATPVLRCALPGKLRDEASPMQIVAALRAASEYVSSVEAIADEYCRQAESTAAVHIAEQEGHIRDLGEIVESFRAARKTAADAAAATEAAKAAAVEADAAQKRAWIEQHGSPRLRRMLAENIEHGATYRDERLTMERPGWEWMDRDEARSMDEPRNPPEAAFALLDAARATEPAAVLRYYARDEDRDYAVTAEFLGRAIVWRDRLALPGEDEEG